MPDFSLEDEALAAEGPLVVGIDEAGRGPWAGPVVAAAVVFDRRRVDRAALAGLDNSKKLSPARRAELHARLRAVEGVAIGVGQASVAEIDAVNILRATMLAMARAVRHLGLRPDFALIDGIHGPALPCRARCVPGGDGRSLSIAAASIVAKVTRDGMMRALAAAHPGYGWERNAGYGTAEHQDALRRLGATPHHRRSFAPVHKILGTVAR